jgi:2-polyprenyl-3-methyl-5-hydroxy-6-metoxy-1,4-benzoquinol methylase
VAHRWHALARPLFRAVSRPSSLDQVVNDDAFELRDRAAAEFLGRFRQRLDWEGADVLDVGSGFGALCFHLAATGAAHVLGIEVNPDRTVYANSLLAGRVRAPRRSGQVRDDRRRRATRRAGL